MRTCVGEYACVCVCVSSIMHVSIMRVQVSIQNAQQNTRWASRCPCIIHNPLYPAYDSLRHSSHNSHGFSICCLVANEPKSRSRGQGTAQDCHRQPALACGGVVPRAAVTTCRVSGESGHLPQAPDIDVEVSHLTDPARYRLVINIIRFLFLPPWNLYYIIFYSGVMFTNCSATE